MRQFTKTNAFELTMVFRIWMKTPFSSEVTLFPTPTPPPPTMLQNASLDVYLFPTLKKGEGEATFHEGRKENLHLGKKVGNFHVSQQL